MADGKEGRGQAEFFSHHAPHHAQSLHMGPKDTAMTRYWQYWVLNNNPGTFTYLGSG